MIPGPAQILRCPACGGKKEVMSLISGNTCGATVWSDARQNYPMLPEVSPIQRCPHCSVFYFLEEAGSEYGADDFSHYSFELGTLSFDELKQAKTQMDGQLLTKNRKWTLNHMLLMAYNDTYMRGNGKETPAPTEEDRMIFKYALSELLTDIDDEPGYGLFHVELLREAGKFDEAMAVLAGQNAEADKWIIDAMKTRITQKDTRPFLLVNEGNRAV